MQVGPSQAQTSSSNCILALSPLRGRPVLSVGHSSFQHWLLVKMGRGHCGSNHPHRQQGARPHANRLLHPSSLHQLRHSASFVHAASFAGRVASSIPGCSLSGDKLNRRSRRPRNRKKATGPLRGTPRQDSIPTGRIPRTGVLLIHGIGSPRPGTTLQQFEAPIRRVFESALDIKHQFIEPEPSKPQDLPFSRRVQIASKDPATPEAELLLVESNWGTLFRRPGPIAFISWVIWMFPVLILLVLIPDSRDEETITAAGGRRANQGGGTAPRLLWRTSLIALFVAFCTVVIGLSPLLPAVTLLVFVFLAMLRSRNWAKDVVAATGLPKAKSWLLEDVMSDLESRIAWLDQECDSVVVIGHSMGGFLGHQLLQRRTSDAKPVHLIGLGSRLRPIILLRAAARSWRVLAAAWLVLASLLIWFVMAIRLMSFVGRMFFLTVGVGVTSGPYSAGTLLSFDDVSYNSTVLSNTRDAYQAIVTLFGTELREFATTVYTWVILAVFFGALMLARGMIKTSGLASSVNADTSLSNQVAGWFEITTTTDIVGRLALPRLPGARQVSVTGVGHFLGDHVGYHRPSTPSVLFVAHVLRGTFPHRVRQLLDVPSIEKVESLNDWLCSPGPGGPSKRGSRCPCRRRPAGPGRPGGRGRGRTAGAAWRHRRRCRAGSSHRPRPPFVHRRGGHGWPSTHPPGHRGRCRPTRPRSDGS